MSSHWKGNDNPGHKHRLALWRQIEDEFEEPIADVIIGLREQGNSWRTVAGCLNISLGTLVEWRKVLGMPLGKHDNVYDPSSLPETTPTDRKAQALGYHDATDAVLDMRLKQRLTIREAAEQLGVHYTTITAYTPPELRGTIYNRSSRWWKQRRRWASDMLERFKTKRTLDKNWHPFNQKNELIFRHD